MMVEAYPEDAVEGKEGDTDAVYRVAESSSHLFRRIVVVAMVPAPPPLCSSPSSFCLRLTYATAHARALKRIKVDISYKNVSVDG